MCDRLIKDQELRCGLLLAYGQPENHLAALGSQIESRLKEDLHVRRISCALSTADTERVTPESLSRDIHTQLRIPSGKSFKAALSQARRDWFPNKSVGLVLLDLGSHGGAQAGKALSGAEVACIAAYLRDIVATDCPTDVRVAALLTLEVQSQKMSAVSAFAEKLRHNQTQQFRVKPLDPVDKVNEPDLFTYLSKRRSGCPQSLVNSFARSIYHRSGGNFEEACRLIEAAHQVGWSETYLDGLGLGAPTAPTPDAGHSEDPL